LHFWRPIALIKPDIKGQLALKFFTWRAIMPAVS
jgi:hypothetical protein